VVLFSERADPSRTAKLGKEFEFEMNPRKGKTFFRKSITSMRLLKTTDAACYLGAGIAYIV
jgi:hypothetical protein